MKIMWLGGIFQKIFQSKPAESAKIDWETVTLIAPGLYQTFIERSFPAAVITLENPWNKAIRDFQAQLRLQGICDWASSSIQEIEPKGKGVIKIILPLPLNKVYDYEEKNANFELKCSYQDAYGKNREYSDVSTIRILAKDDMIWELDVFGIREDLCESIAAWITPRDDSVQKFIHESANNDNAKAVGGLLGYQESQQRMRVKKKYTVAAGKYVSIKLHLKQNSVVRGVLNEVIGGSGNDIRFGLLDSDEMIMLTSSIIQKAPILLKLAKSGHQIMFNTPIESDYYMVFDNTFSNISKKGIDTSIEIIQPLTHEEIVRYQLEAVYETIQQKGYSYVSSPISYAPGVSQRVKRPAKTLELKGGNCIDGCVLLASCFEALSLDTHIIILPTIGHSLVAVKTWFDSKEFYIIETSVIGSSSFEESLRIANDTYSRYRDTARWISVAEARKKRIMPLA
jgi:hypothetical protein